MDDKERHELERAQFPDYVIHADMVDRRKAGIDLGQKAAFGLGALTIILLFLGVADVIF